MMPLVLFFFSWVCLGISSLLHVYSHEHCQAGQMNITIRYKKLVCLLHCDTTVHLQRKKRKRQLYPQKREVPVVLDAGYFQVAHDYLTVLIVFAQGSVLLFQVRERAQLILCSCAHCQDKKKHGKLCKLYMTCTMTIFPSTLFHNNLLQFPELKYFECY